MPTTLRYVLNVGDFIASVEFWTSVLGLRLVGGWDRGPDDRGALVEVTPGGVVEIVGHGPAFDGIDYRQQAVAIELADEHEVDTFHRRLVSYRIAASAPVRQPWGHYSTTTRDPNHLEVVLYCEVRA